MNLSQWLAFSTWLIPIPFMLLYHLKTSRLNFLTYPVIILPTLFSILATIFSNPFYFHPDVLFSYSITIGLGMILLRIKKGLTFPKAFSLSFITALVTSFYWEIPIFLYTIAHRGYIDVAAPLHILSAFPALFLHQKIKVKDKRITLLLILGIFASTLFMLPLIKIGVLQTFLSTSGFAPPVWLQIYWSINRILCFLPLIYIVYRSELKL